MRIFAGRFSRVVCLLLVFCMVFGLVVSPVAAQTVPPGTYTYSATFHANGGTPARQTAATRSRTTYGQLFAQIQSPVKIDEARSTSTEEFMMQFIGWFTTPDGSGVQIHATDPLTPDSPRTLYARWESVPDLPRTLVTVTFEANGPGTLTGDMTTQVLVGSSLTAEQLPTPVTDTSTCTAWGSTFGYWRSPQIPGWYPDLTELVITEATTFVAVFSVWVGSCTITLLRNDGSVGADNVFMRIPTDHGLIIYVPESPIREGYIFAGWTTDAAGNDPFDLSVGQVSTGGCINLYAQWEPLSTAPLVTVTFGYSGPGTLVGNMTTQVPVGSSLTAEQIPAPVADPASCGRFPEFLRWASPQIHGLHLDLTELIITQATTFTAVFGSPTAGAHITLLRNDGSIGADNVFGTVETDHGKILSVPAPPTREGYIFAGWATDAAGSASFDLIVGAMASGCIYLYAQWEPVVALPPITFTDVAADRWYHDYIQFVAHHNIMQGVGDNRFSPGDDFSRAMLATTLWRMSFEPPWWFGEELPDFQDVAPDRWYSTAVIWAFTIGVVQGFDATTFAPADSVTREQFATMLFRYAEATGIDTTVPDALDWARFKDRHTISDWAEDAMVWAVYHGLIFGTSDTTLSPQEGATRAQSAAILMRFMQTF